MKKAVTLIAAVAMLMSCVLLSTAAAPTVFTDEATSDFANVFEYSEDVLQFENNPEIEATLYSKKALGEAYLTYKVEGTITNFRILSHIAAGFGDFSKDAEIYLSADNAAWDKVEFDCTDAVYNDHYPSESAAYWWDQTAMAKGTISGNYSYLKIVLKEFDQVAWRTVIDQVTIQYQPGSTTPEPSVPAVFTDEATDDFANVFEYSEDVLQFENNTTIEATLYSKKNLSEGYLTYKVDGSITNFRILSHICAGFGDFSRDAEIYLSADNAAWDKVEFDCTDPVYNDHYESESTAYWFDQTATAQGTISGNYSYLKIVLKEFDQVAWRTVIDQVTIQYQSGGTTPSTSSSTASTATTTESSASTESSATTTESTAAPTTPAPVAGQLVDDTDASFSKTFDVSDNIQYEENPDLGRNLYSKKRPTSLPDPEGYVVYKLDGAVTAFTINAVVCNADQGNNGDVDRDLSVYVSTDGETWIKAAMNHTDPVIIEGSNNYWMDSTVTGTVDPAADYRYVKVQINSIDVAAGIPTWAVVLDKITIDYQTGGSTESTATTSETPVTTSTEAPAVSSTQAPATTSAKSPSTGDNGAGMVMALLGVAALSAGALTVLKKRSAR